MKNRFDDLNGDDPIIRRLEMIRLLRSGRPVDEIASAYNAEPQYIFRLDELFSRSGTLGILTEDDFLSYRSLNPEHIRICSFNLHGIHRIPKVCCQHCCEEGKHDNCNNDLD